MLAVAPFVGGDDDAVDVTTASAATESGTDVVRAASLGSPSEVRELLSETTTTLVEATGATTSTTGVPATSTTSTVAAPAEDEDEGDDEVTATTTTTTEDTSVRAQQVESSTTPAAPTTTAAPARKTTATTAAPRPAPTTTVAPTTTSTAPPPPKESTGEGYAYDDPRSTQVWYDLAECESGGNWSINTGNGYYGGLQFSLPTWESVGGPGYPHEHPAATQIDFGRKLQARQGWGAWPHCSEKLGLR